MTPEQKAREQIDAMLALCGWEVQDYKKFNASACRGLTLREVPLKTGPCDFLLPPAGFCQLFHQFHFRARLDCWMRQPAIRASSAMTASPAARRGLSPNLSYPLCYAWTRKVTEHE